MLLKLNKEAADIEEIETYNYNMDIGSRKQSS